MRRTEHSIEPSSRGAERAVAIHLFHHMRSQTWIATRAMHARNDENVLHHRSRSSRSAEHPPALILRRREAASRRTRAKTKHKLVSPMVRDAAAPLLTMRRTEHSIEPSSRGAERAVAIHLFHYMRSQTWIATRAMHARNDENVLHHRSRSTQGAEHPPTLILRRREAASRRTRAKIKHKLVSPMVRDAAAPPLPLASLPPAP